MFLILILGLIIVRRALHDQYPVRRIGPLTYRDYKYEEKKLS